MCRLFGLAAAEPVRAAFWLLEAPDSLAEQSRRNPDGYGLAALGPGGWEVDKAPVAAYADAGFRRDATERVAPRFLAHVRYASVGAHTLENTHPFEMDGRVLAHNGHIGGLDRLEAELGPDMARVHGDTDSERFFALATREIARRDGDVGGGLVAAARWVAAELPLFALNVIVGAEDGLWALRYPDAHDLLVLERAPGGPGGDRHLEHASAAGRIRVRSGDLAERPSVVVATERMDEDPGWRALQSGELLHIARDLTVTRDIALPDPPVHPLTLADLAPDAAAAQSPSGKAAA
jgi:predicted glutamine amidotransferase